MTTKSNSKKLLSAAQDALEKATQRKESASLKLGNVTEQLRNFETPLTEIQKLAVEKPKLTAELAAIDEEIYVLNSRIETLSQQVEAEDKAQHTAELEQLVEQYKAEIPAWQERVNGKSQELVELVQEFFEWVQPAAEAYHQLNYDPSIHRSEKVFIGVSNRLTTPRIVPADGIWNLFVLTTQHFSAHKPAPQTELVENLSPMGDSSESENLSPIGDGEPRNLLLRSGEVSAS